MITTLVLFTFLFSFLLFPIISVLRSKKISGMEKWQWFLLVLLFSWLIYPVYLIKYRKKKVQVVEEPISNEEDVENTIVEEPIANEDIEESIADLFQTIDLEDNKKGSEEPLSENKSITE